MSDAAEPVTAPGADLWPWIDPAAVDALWRALQRALPDARRLAVLGAAAPAWAARGRDGDADADADAVTIVAEGEPADVVVAASPDALPADPDDEAAFVAALVARAGAVVLATVSPAAAVDRPGRWPAYWADRFAPHGWVLIDAIRPGIWHDSHVATDVKEGALLFVGPSAADGVAAPPGPLAVLHPHRQTETLRAFEARLDRFRQQVDAGWREAASSGAAELETERLRNRAIEARLAVLDRRLRELESAPSQGPGASDAARAIVGRLAGRSAGRGPDAAPGVDPAVAALFDAHFYATHSPEAADAPLAHYLRHGEAEGRRPNACFDPAFYRNRNPDVVAAGLGALEHYARYGGAEGRAASAEFDTAWYVQQHPDVKLSGLHPMLHYLAIGQTAGYAASPAGAARAAGPDGPVYAPMLAGTPGPGPTTDAKDTAPQEPTMADPSDPGAARRPLCGTYVGNGRVLVYLQTGGRLLVSSDDLTLVSELLQDGIYDVPFTRFLQRTLRPDSVFVDVGANVGLFSIVAGYLAWEGRTIAYEAAPFLARLVQDNVAANWFADRITVRPVAVGAAAGRATFGFPTSMHTLGGLHLDTASFNALYPEVTVEQVDVEVVSLDDDLGALGVDGVIDLVKVDVEGGEPDVLRGMQGLLEAGRIRQLSMEVRRDAHERNRGAGAWEDMAGELHRLAALGAAFGAPDEHGVLQPLSLDEVLRTALYANLVATLPV
ncbi:MAG: FkbM family methyltransferase [Acidimicrobiales bacterium]